MALEARTLRLPGEERLAVLEDGRLLAMRIRRAGDGPWPGSRWRGRLVAATGRRGQLDAAGETIDLEGLPAGTSLGAKLVVRIVRAPIVERLRRKPARARVVPEALDALSGLGAEGEVEPAPSLADELGLGPGGSWTADLEALWREELALVEAGMIELPGGRLIVEPTAGGTVFDVDGEAPDLGTRAVDAVARALLAWGLGGSILVDLPVPPGRRGWREEAGRAFDAAVARWPRWAPGVERTAVNGFGLMQIVAPRRQPSILERVRWQPVGHRAHALLAEAARGLGPGEIRAPPEVARWLAARPALLAETERQRGGRLQLSVAEPRPFDDPPGL